MPSYREQVEERRGEERRGVGIPLGCCCCCRNRGCRWLCVGCGCASDGRCGTAAALFVAVVVVADAQNYCFFCVESAVGSDSLKGKKKKEREKKRFPAEN